MLGVIKMANEETKKEVKGISEKQKNEMPAGSYVMIAGKLKPNLDDEAMKKRNKKIKQIGKQNG